jgi:hypothetical protein
VKQSRLIHRLSSLLRRPKGKLTLNLAGDMKAIENGYYRSLGQTFKTLQIFAFVGLFLFTTVFALSNTESITYENLYYFVKDFRTAIDNTDESGTALVYETDQNTAFISYKGGLAVAGSERLQLYTATGYLNASAALDFYAPELEASTSRLMIYDRGGTSCQIYNSFTKIHSQVEDHDIRLGHLCESGEYLLVTDDEEYSSAVMIYSKRFRRVNRLLLNSYVVSAALNAEGSRASILSYVCENGVYETRLLVTAVGSDKVELDYTINGEFPLGVAFVSNDTALLLTDTQVYVVSSKGTVRAVERFFADTVQKFVFTDTHLAVLTKKDDKFSLIAFDNSGEMVYNTTTEDGIYALAGYRNIVFCRSAASLLRVNLENGKMSSVSCTSEGVLLTVSEHRALICGSGEAKYFRFSS